MKKHNIEEQFQKYLSLVGLKGVKIPERQEAEMRRVFFGAYGMFIDFLKQDVGDEDEAVETLTDIGNQVLEFWENESKERLSKNKN